MNGGASSAGAQKPVGRSRLLTAAATLTVAVMCVAPGPALGGMSRTSGQIVFYPNTADFVPGQAYNPNVPSVRPALVLMLEDGSWVIKNLHWSTWGAATARAAGISSSSNCKPNCAQGKRTNHPVSFVVSKPKHLFGRTVYTCFRLTDPKAPQTNYYDCLHHATGNQYAYAPVAVKPAAPTALTFETTLAGGIGCGMNSGPTLTQVFCQSGNPHGQASQGHGATLHADGTFTSCGLRCVGNLGEGAPTYAVGKTATVGPFTCTVESGGVRCVVTKTGKGFLFTEDTVTAVP
jgi:hypothetical protein